MLLKQYYSILNTKFITIKKIIVIGRPELLLENKSQRSKERAAKILSDEKKFGHLYRALQKSAKKSRKTIMPVLDRLNKS
jgi:hypothetical protein